MTAPNHPKGATMKEIEMIQTELAGMANDIEKFKKGVKASVPRLRKSLQNIAVWAKDGRKALSEAKEGM